MPEPARPLGQGAVPGFILDAVRDVRPHQAGAVDRFLVDAHDAQAARFQVRHDHPPASRVVPVLAAAAALHGDHGVGGLDRAAAGIGDDEVGRRLGRVHAQDVGRGAVQAHLAEIGRLPIARRIVEEQAEGIGGVKGASQRLALELVVRDEAKGRIGVLQERDDGARERACDAGTQVPGSEAGGGGKPGQRVTQRADREQDEDFLVGRVPSMLHDRAFDPVRIELRDVDGETDPPPLAAGDGCALVLALEQDVAGVLVAKPDAPLPFRAWRQDDAGARVEVEADAGGADLGGHGRRRRKGGRCGARRCRRRFASSPECGYAVHGLRRVEICAGRTECCEIRWVQALEHSNPRQAISWIDVA